MPRTSHRRPQERSDQSALVGVFEMLPAWAVLPVLALGGLLAYVASAALGVPPALTRTLLEIYVMVTGISAIVGRVHSVRARRRLETTRRLEDLRAMSWTDFEALVLSAYRARGYSGSLTNAGADGGVDIILQRGQRRTLVQCKQWRAQTIRPDAIRSLKGVMALEGVEHGIFVASGRFTPEALAVAKSSGIEAVDGEALFALVAEACGVSPAGATRVSVDRIVAAGAPDCPRCKGEMVTRVGPRGEFWGCARFPACRGTVSLSG